MPLYRLHQLNYVTPPFFNHSTSLRFPLYPNKSRLITRCTWSQCRRTELLRLISVQTQQTLTTPPGPACCCPTKISLCVWYSRGGVPNTAHRVRWRQRSSEECNKDTVEGSQGAGEPRSTEHLCFCWIARSHVRNIALGLGCENSIGALLCQESPQRRLCFNCV